MMDRHRGHNTYWIDNPWRDHPCHLAFSIALGTFSSTVNNTAFWMPATLFLSLTMPSIQIFPLAVSPFFAHGITQRWINGRYCTSCSPVMTINKPNIRVYGGYDVPWVALKKATPALPTHPQHSLWPFAAVGILFRYQAIPVVLPV